jgi:hypothetical protein
VWVSRSTLTGLFFLPVTLLDFQFKKSRPTRITTEPKSKRLLYAKAARCIPAPERDHNNKST